ncbi:ribosomal RNA small subunit methyltransferase A [Nitrososphaera viennensis]|uniref:rRNA adenine N(6)-methyltransferase family protein n=2 Tax=Nitrososphaera viennensis TaxID=1034015 RepID=A0A977IDI7_9ARCH|nr:rRNA adenine dimethyltransferase family protein [Nitrososphaera viennensis]AIC17122.1 putative ribosomal RNA small subunit methyltransferase A [Nitrososphaera viennensis EN76]UVS69014.1 rRNA adenine N(6)-methyltransferase family protein [Nitrososphaera viennensis]
MPRRTKTQALGQHFLADRRVLARIVDASAIGKGETVCEAGTGSGILTEELCRHAKKVVSYEVDRELYIHAKAKLASSNLEFVNADLFKRDEQLFDVFVSNLPYSKSRDAFEWLAARKFDRAIVMVQKEFAEKLLAKPGDSNYRAISAIASYCFHLEKLFDVGKECFNPPPLVESTVIRATLKHSITRETVKNINRLFSQRNKRASTVAAKLGIQMDFGDRRVDQLVPAQIIALASGMIA